jgi:predicted ATPase/DNA-binding winged helix-turn-helix (wHTH) protein
LTLSDYLVDGAEDSAPLDGKTTILFAGCRLQVHARRLFVNGELAELGSRTFELLMALIESRGDIISKSRIMSRVWPHMPMDEGNLRVQMHAIRRILGNDRHVIRTIPGRGYLFAADVTITAGEAEGSVVPARPRAQAGGVFVEAPAGSDTNLPLSLGALIGRAAELAELREHLELRRLVTLVGTGGIGKTRLAVELGRRMSAEYPDGVWLVDLAPVTDPAKVTGTTAAALGVVLGDAAAPVETIAAAIGQQRKLLIMDNCEHLIDAAAGLVAALLMRAPGLSVLATSQESLGVPGEQIYRLNPLDLPTLDASDPENIGKIAGSGAIALFVERAREADPRFELDRRNVWGVAEICRHLDGIPLALEMAAARLPLLGIDGLRAGLGDRLRMLRRNPRAGEQRHMTLGAMIEWSHGLLDAAEGRVFRRLAVFVGSFSLDAAIAVVGESADRWEIVEILGRLIDKSLVTIEDGEPPRYRLLETLRVYGMEQLRASGESEAIADRHGHYFAELFDHAYEQWETTADAEWVEAYRRELDNVRAALDWALADPARVKVAAAMAGPFAIVWYNLGLIVEGRRYADRILAGLGRDVSLAAARFLRFSSYLWDSSDRRRTLTLLERSAAIYRQLNDQMDLAPVLATIGRLYAGQHRDAEAEAVLREAQELLSHTDRKKSLLGVVSTLASFAYHKRDVAEAMRQLTRALELARGLKDTVRVANILANMAENDFLAGAVDRAEVRGREALAIMRSTNRHSHREWALVNLASYLIAQGNIAEARSLAEEALAEGRGTGGLIVRICLQLWALIGAREGRYEAAARLIGFVDRSYAASGEIREPTEQQIYGDLQRALAANVPASGIEAYAADGAGWDEHQAVSFALDHLISNGRKPRPPEEAAAPFMPVGLRPSG